MNIMRKQRQQRNQERLKQILTEKPHDELVEQYQRLQETHREASARFEEERKILIADRERLEAQLYCSGACREGLESALTVLLDKHRAVVTETIRLQNQIASMQTELQNRQEQLNQLRTVVEVESQAEDLEAIQMSEISEELMALASP